MKQDLFSIGEVAGLFHISISTLRHYDRLGLVKPEYTDAQTGYRYYSTQQFEALNTIRYLRTLNMPLKQIAQFLQNRQIERIRTLLLRQRDEVARYQEELKNIQKKIDNRIAQIDDAVASELDRITMRRYPPRKIALLKRSFTVAAPENLEIYIRELERDERDTAIFLGKVGIGFSRESLLKKDLRIYDVVFLLPDEEDHYAGPTTLLPEETCAVLRFRGSHENAPGQYRKMLEYMKEHGLEIGGFSREITLIDYGITSEPSEFVTEIQIPVKK